MKYLLLIISVGLLGCATPRMSRPSQVVCIPQDSGQLLITKNSTGALTVCSDSAYGESLTQLSGPHIRTVELVVQRGKCMWLVVTTDAVTCTIMLVPHSSADRSVGISDDRQHDLKQLWNQLSKSDSRFTITEMKTLDQILGDVD
jgi:hypothetical protein